MTSPKFTRNWWLGFSFPLTFLLCGFALLPHPGIQNDEVLFAMPSYHLAGSSIFDFEIRGWHVPVMFLTYLGALKTWLCAPIFALFDPSYLTLRVPVLLVGAMTIWTFVRLLETCYGWRAAWIGGLLLATDTMFLLTTCFDWGPVALQHFLLVAGVLLILKFYSRASRFLLFCGFLCFGLGLWDKALFTWMLGGLVVATLVVFPREIQTRFTLKNAGIAMAGLVVGALPLIVYNVSLGFPTLHSNSTFVLDQFRGKAGVLLATWKGSSLFGYLTSGPDSAVQLREPKNLLERTSMAMHSRVGEHSSNGLEGALGLALLLVPLLWRSSARKALLFCLITVSAAWFQMAITKDAGFSAHHIVLLWPLPHFFIAIAFAEASRRLPWRKAAAGLLGIAMLYFAGENLLLTNQYLFQFVRYGSGHPWTDAIYDLSAEVGKLGSPQIVIDDWGILCPLVFLQRGTLRVVTVDDAFLAPAASDAQKHWDRGLLEQAVWIGHTPPFQELLGQYDKFTRIAVSAGFRKELIKLVPDSHGRAAFEIFRFVRAN